MPLARASKESVGSAAAPSAEEGAHLIETGSESQAALQLKAKHQVEKPQTKLWLKWGSLVLLVLQNSSLFVVARYTREPGHKGKPYLTSVLVLLVELFKMLICLALLLRASEWSPVATGRELWRFVIVEWRTTLLVGVPAACYALSNNLLFFSISNLSAAAAQVLYQTKTLSTALFTVTLLGRTFRVAQWLSFCVLGAGVVLVQSQDAKSSKSPTGASPILGALAALLAAALSGFAGVYLERMFTSGSASLWMRNVQLGLFAIPLQLVAIAQMDGARVARHGPLQGFHLTTWLVVAIQVFGALLTAVVIKFAGNVLKTFATVLALLCTCAWSMLLFQDFQPTRLVRASALALYHERVRLPSLSLLT
jgi:UDP-sugar transporter A1/2/3